MKHYLAIESWLRGLLVVCLLAVTAEAKTNDAITLAKEILGTSGVQGGIVVHVGCGDGKLTAALHAGEGWT